ncbi:hypothetical protein [Nocardia sp. NPDC057030]|uniref:hypothetical protein n=1 Tax=unclassified Nocardia TaxID=2637762 RepID=UPI0036412512
MRSTTGFFAVATSAAPPARTGTAYADIAAKPSDVPMASVNTASNPAAPAAGFDDVRAAHAPVFQLIDPADRRARLVRLTRRGWAVVDAGVGVVERFDRHLDEIVGADEIARLRDTLLRIIGGAGSSYATGAQDPKVMRVE